MLEQGELLSHCSHPPSQLTWTGFAHGEGFEDGEFWKVSGGTCFTMGELQKWHEFGPDSSLYFLRMNRVRRPRWIWD